MTKVKFFGTSSANPSSERGFACIGIESKAGIVLLNCGDGSVRRIIQSDEDVGSISSIFITHHHSDHLSWFAQIIETMGIQRRKKDLKVNGPKGLLECFDNIARITDIASKRSFEIEINELKPGQSVSLQDEVVHSFQMEHTIPCLGYRIETADGIIAYTGDTVPCEGSTRLAESADLLIHEATFLKKDIAKARESKHLVPEDATISAKSVGAKMLVLTHVNDKYETPEEMTQEASKICKGASVAFDNLTLGVEGNERLKVKIEVRFIRLPSRGCGVAWSSIPPLGGGGLRFES